jgi:hypothetical protein
VDFSMEDNFDWSFDSRKELPVVLAAR